MRQMVTPELFEKFLETFGKALSSESRIYLTGGSSAIANGWRESTLDIDLKSVPEAPNFFQVIQDTKNLLNLNIEIASPDHFVPALPGWQGRSKHIDRHGKTDFYHFDYYTQAFAKIVRGHERDHIDVEGMVKAGFVEANRLRDLFMEVESEIMRYPALSAEKVKTKVLAWCDAHE